MNKISQVELYKTLIKPLGRSIEDHLKENPEKLVEYYIYHWLRFKEAFPGKSILSLVDTETVLLIDSFHFRFNNLRVKILNKRIKEYKRKLAFEGKRAQQGYKFYCRLKETLIEKYQEFKNYVSLTIEEKKKLLESPFIKEKFEKIVADIQKEFASYEKIKKFKLLPEEFTIEKGEITPTLKIKRRVVLEKLNSLIEGMYA